MTKTQWVTIYNKGSLYQDRDLRTGKLRFAIYKAWWEPRKDPTDRTPHPYLVSFDDTPLPRGRIRVRWKPESLVTQKITKQEYEEKRREVRERLLREQRGLEFYPGKLDKLEEESVEEWFRFLRNFTGQFEFLPNFRAAKVSKLEGEQLRTALHMKNALIHILIDYSYASRRAYENLFNESDDDPEETLRFGLEGVLDDIRCLRTDCGEDVFYRVFEHERATEYPKYVRLLFETLRNFLREESERNSLAHKDLVQHFSAVKKANNETTYDSVPRLMKSVLGNPQIHKELTEVHGIHIESLEGEGSKTWSIRLENPQKILKTVEAMNREYR